MKRGTSFLIAVALAAGLGATVFSARSPAGASAFNGPFAGGTGGDVIINSNNNLCLNGSPCTVRLQYDGGTVGVVGAALEPAAGAVGVTESIQSALLGEDLSVDHLVVTNPNTGADALTVLGGRVRLAPVDVNSNAYFYFDSASGFYFANYLNIADGAYIRVDNLEPKRSTETVSLYGAHGLTLVPQASVDACSSGREGQITTLTTDGFAYQCNGAINTRLQGTLWSAVTSIDVGNLASHGVESHTVTVTGATTADLPTCRPLTAPTTDIDTHEYVSAANTVTIMFHNDSGGNVDPAATDYQCIVFVK